MDIVSVATLLREERVPIARLQTVPLAGVYAFFLHTSPFLSTFPVGRDGLVYVGKTSDLEQRNSDTHFSSETSGFSSLRRSLGAVLKDVLDLTAQPRGASVSPSNFWNYAFVIDGEKRLSRWMETNLLVGMVALNAGEEAVFEEGLIKAECPLLNLKGCKNSHRKAIKALRKVCANEARRSAGLREK